MKSRNLGELEELVLLAVAGLHGNAYGNALLEALNEHANRTMKLSTIHVALQRLEKKGFLSSKFGDSTPQRGGRRKRYFEVTASGYSVMRAVYETRNRMWNLVPKEAF